MLFQLSYGPGYLVPAPLLQVKLEKEQCLEGVVLEIY